MAKQGMKRPDWTHPQPKNQAGPVPEIQGKAKHGKEKAKPIVSGTSGQGLKVYHTEKPIPSDPFPAFDSDLAKENLSIHIPAADLEDM